MRNSLCLVLLLITACAAPRPDYFDGQSYRSEAAVKSITYCSYAHRLFQNQESNFDCRSNFPYELTLSLRNVTELPNVESDLQEYVSHWCDISGSLQGAYGIQSEPQVHIESADDPSILSLSLTCSEWRKGRPLH